MVIDKIDDIVMKITSISFCLHSCNDSYLSAVYVLEQ